jgi:hypothetical protein
VREPAWAGPKGVDYVKTTTSDTQSDSGGILNMVANYRFSGAPAVAVGDVRA